MFSCQGSQVLLKDVRLFAHHGVLSQERTVGGWFVLNIRLSLDFSEAMQTDNLDGTVSYADVFEVVKAEMAIPSQLLEHVAGRIVRALFRTFPNVNRIYIELLKENPPMGAECAGAGVVIDATPDEVER